MIDYRALEALAAVIQHHGFDNAAKSLHITQSAVSQRIKHLEGQLGQPLIIRQTPPIATELGIKLITHLQTVRHLEADLKLAASDEHIQARIAVSADALATWFAQAIGQITEEIALDLVVADQDSGIKLMKRGEVLATLCAESNPVNGARVDSLGTMRYRAYASTDFLTRYQLNESIEHIHKAPCLIFNKDDQLQHRFLKSLNLPAPLSPIRCPSSEGFLKLAIAGCGFGLMPEIQAASAVNSGQIVDIAPDHFIDISLFWHSWQTSGSTMKRLRTETIETAKQWLRQS